MALVALCAALGGLGVLHFVCLRQWAAERRTLIAAVMSRHAGEFAVASPQRPPSRRSNVRLEVSDGDESTEHEMIGVSGL